MNPAPASSPILSRFRTAGARLWQVAIGAACLALVALTAYVLGSPGLLALTAAVSLGGVGLWLFRRPRLTFALYLLALPFHTGVFQVARVELGLSPSVSLLLQSWKEIAIGLMLLWVIGRVFLTGKLLVRHPWMLLLLGAFAATGVVALLRAPSLLAGLYAYRGTFEPFLVLFLALTLPLDWQWLRRMLPLLLVVSAVVAVFAIYQALFLGFGFLWKYYAVSGSLASSFSSFGRNVQRAMGTFASPNQLGLYLALIMILVLNLVLRKLYRRLWLLGLFGVLLTVLVFTVSRSAWLAFLTGAAVSLLIWRRKQRALLVAFFVLLVALPVLVHLGLDEYLIRTLSGREASANYHVVIFADNLGLLGREPLGVGLGRVGARTAVFAGPMPSTPTYATESYLLQTGMELGLPGLFLFLAIALSAGVVLYRNIFRLSSRWSRALAVSALAMIVAALVDSLLIPALQDLACSVYLWSFVGIGMSLPAIEASAGDQP